MTGVRSSVAYTDVPSQRPKWIAPASSMASPQFSALIEQHYATLRRIAARALRNRTHPGRLSPTSLIAESVIRLLQQRQKPSSEEHLRGLATVFMARVLADASKTRRRAKRGGGQSPKSIEDPEIEFDLSTRTGNPNAPSVIRSLVHRDALLAAMEELATEHPRKMEIITLHLVGDIPLARVATLVGVSERTAFRDLEAGRLALAAKLRELHG
jgi:RNA polymerase sigma factor (sigma-70 family)